MMRSAPIFSAWSRISRAGLPSQTWMAAATPLSFTSFAISSFAALVFFSIRPVGSSART